MLVFGHGNLYAVSSAVNATPRKFAVLQDVSFDFTFTTKSLHGDKQFAVDIRRGTGKMTGKAKMAQIKGKMLNALFFGESSTTGQLLSSVDEQGVITTNVVTVANGATFDTDLGVVNAATGLGLTKVAATPAAGQYAVSSVGVYTFNTADNNKAMLFDYLYTSATGGTRISLGQKAIGATPKFYAIFTVTVDGQTMTLRLNSCTSNKLALATKKEDHAIPEFDFEAMLDASGKLGELSVSD